MYICCKNRSRQFTAIKVLLFWVIFHLLPSAILMSASVVQIWRPDHSTNVLHEATQKGIYCFGLYVAHFSLSRLHRAQKAPNHQFRTLQSFASLCFMLLFFWVSIIELKKWAEPSSSFVDSCHWKGSMPVLDSGKYLQQFIQYLKKGCPPCNGRLQKTNTTYSRPLSTSKEIRTQ